MTKKPLKIEDLYLNRAKFVMKFLGVWKPSDDESIIRKVYRVFMMSLQYLFLLFQIIYIVQIKVDDLKALLAQMNGKMFEPQSEVHEKILKTQAQRIKRLLLGFMVSSQTTCGLWALKPLFDDAGSRNFPFDMWMPVHPDRSGQYEAGYGFQLMTICMSAYMYFGVDSVALSMVIFGCAQVDIVKDKIKSIKSPTEKNKNDKAILLEENYNKLIECAVHHQAVVSFTTLVEDAYHTYLLLQLTGSVGLICMSALRILVVDWKSMQFFSILTYLSVMISQLYVCCWCGHELTATSEELHTTLYECAWYEQTPRFRRALIFMMMRAGKPMVFRAGHYIALSRQNFVAILRMSYSYFAVLNQTK